MDSFYAGNREKFHLNSCIVSLYHTTRNVISMQLVAVVMLWCRQRTCSRIQNKQMNTCQRKILN